jgi:hypothetical protein
VRLMSEGVLDAIGYLAKRRRVSSVLERLEQAVTFATGQIQLSVGAIGDIAPEYARNFFPIRLNGD